MSDRRLPDFILGGAMKSGTSSLHALLDEHPDVFIPSGEIHFFDIDDPEHAGEFFVHFPDGWTWQDFDTFRDAYLDWYAAFFEPGVGRAQVGEDSTGYLTSRSAPGRIRELMPNVKLIFILRDPVTRTYSHYWHLVRTSRALFDFETTLERTPSPLLRRSRYRDALERWFSAFDRDQVHVVLFEEFRDEPQSVLDEIFEFLGLDPSVDVASTRSHVNRSFIPAIWEVKLAANWLRTLSPSLRYYEHLPSTGTRVEAVRRMSVAQRVAHAMAAGVDRLVEQMPKKRYPPMKAETEEFLQRYFARENRGLSELLQRDLAEYWPYFLS